MSEHTPEPWAAEMSRIVRPLAGTYAEVVIPAASDWRRGAAPSRTLVEAVANARRIVACVNACQDVDIDLMEGDDPVSFSATAARLAEAERLLRLWHKTYHADPCDQRGCQTRALLEAKP